jgi:3-oxoacyl-[acyl-carrier-protein] synthase II
MQRMGTQSCCLETPFNAQSNQPGTHKIIHLMRRIVITGMGAVSGNGSTVSEIWESLLAGKADRCTITPDRYFDVNSFAKACSTKEGLINMVCGSPLTIEGMAARLGIKGAGRIRRYDRHQYFAYLAAEEAVAQAGLAQHEISHRFGCVVGTGDGGLHESYVSTIELLEGRPLSPFANLRELPNVFAGLLAQRFRLRGPNHVHCTACAASAHAMQHAADLIRLDRADAIMTGGAEAVITPFGIASFCSQSALSNHSKPYRIDRTGFLMGEGAAILIFEELEHALRRGAHIYAEIAGYGATADGEPGSLITDPGLIGGIAAAQAALSMAEYQPWQVDYVNTHGTGTPAGDSVELQGIASWAGCIAPTLPVSSTKSYTGHLLGAAAALEAVLCAQSIAHRRILPTHGLTAENIDPNCTQVFHVMGGPLERKVDVVLSNSFGFGGTNASMVFKRYA